MIISGADKGSGLNTINRLHQRAIVATTMARLRHRVRDYLQPIQRCCWLVFRTDRLERHSADGLLLFKPMAIAGRGSGGSHAGGGAGGCAVCLGAGVRR